MNFKQANLLKKELMNHFESVVDGCIEQYIANDEALKVQMRDAGAQLGVETFELKFLLHLKSPEGTQSSLGSWSSARPLVNKIAVDPAIVAMGD